MMFSHKNVTVQRQQSRSSCSWSWKQWCCLFVSLYCCLNHSAYGQLPSALTTTTTSRTTVASDSTTRTKTITPRVIVESIALDEHKKLINTAGNNEKAYEKTAVEIPQLPHAFRHQQHYSQRIEQAVNDFKLQQQQQLLILQQQQKQQESHLKERDKVISNKTRKYYQQKDQQHHQRRHEHHQQQLQQQPLYHLRHRNHYAAAWEKQSIPTLRHQRHRNGYNITETTTTTTAPTRAILQESTTEAGIELDDNVDNGHDHLELQANGAILFTTNVSNNNAMRRYFDREALYRRQPVTKSPIKRWSSTHTPYKWQAPPDAMYADASNNLSGNRLTLKMQDKKLNFYRNADNVDIDNDDVDDGSIGDDDYSYEQSTEDFFAEKLNNLPTSKPPVKRFTNPFKNFFKSLRGYDANKQRVNNNDEYVDDEKYRLRVQQHHMRQQQHQQELEAMRSWHNGIGGNMLNSGLNKYATNTNSNSNHNHQASLFFIYFKSSY